jgi:hypothetical protein
MFSVTFKLDLYTPRGLRPIFEEIYENDYIFEKHILN